MNKEKERVNKEKEIYKNVYKNIKFDIEQDLLKKIDEGISRVRRIQIGSSDYQAGQIQALEILRKDFNNYE